MKAFPITTLLLLIFIAFSVQSAPTPTPTTQKEFAYTDAPLMMLLWVDQIEAETRYSSPEILNYWKEGLWIIRIVQQQDGHYHVEIVDDGGFIVWEDCPE